MSASESLPGYDAWKLATQPEPGEPIVNFPGGTNTSSIPTMFLIFPARPRPEPGSAPQFRAAMTTQPANHETERRYEINSVRMEPYPFQALWPMEDWLKG